MNYTLNQLQVFQKIAQTGSVTKAAEELHLTQPAVSIQLRNFQNQFDIPLTEVIGRKIYITDFGREIALAAEQILEQVDAIQHKTLAYRGQLFGKLKVSVVSTGKYVMPYFLTAFMQANPGVELEMDVTNKTKVIKSLEANEVDFSLVSILPDHLMLNHVDLLENKLYLVGNQAANFTEQPDLKALFEQSPLIFREKGSGTRQSMEKFIAAQQLKVPKKMELTSNEAVKQAVLAGLGYSIMPLIGIRNELQNGSMKIITVNGLPLHTVWQLIWLKSKNLSPVAKAYLQHISLEKQRIVDFYFSHSAQIPG